MDRLIDGAYFQNKKQKEKMMMMGVWDLIFFPFQFFFCRSHGQSKERKAQF